MVASRVESSGLGPWRLGGELWGFGGRAESGPDGVLDGLCFSGANLIPLRGERSAIRGFADRARRHGRICSSLVGRSDLVLALWEELEPDWAPAREVRPDQPLLVLARPPSLAPD